MQNPSEDENSRTEQRVHIGIYIMAILAVAAVLISALRLFKYSASPEAGQPSGPGNSNSVTQALPIPLAENTNLATHPVDSGGNRPTIEKAQIHSESPISKKSVQELGGLLQDSRLSSDERRGIVAALVENGSTEAIAILKNALATGSEELRTVIAEALGTCSNSDCKQALLGLLSDQSESVVRAAIRGLAKQDTPEGFEALTRTLLDDQRSLDVRVEAASGLGTSKQPRAVEALGQAVTLVNDSDVASEILRALGTRDFSETKDFFLNYLRSPNVDPELRTTAVEALAQAEGNPTEFLSSMLMDGDSDVRAAAAWTMSATDAKGNAGSALIARLQTENDPDVRLRLYQALRNQENVDVPTILNQLQQEQDLGARIAGLDFLAKTVRDKPTTESQSFFDQRGVPALKDAALNGDTTGTRLAAVLALARAGTATSVSTLEEIAQQATDPRVKDAARGSTRIATISTK
jgi:HEAT repeat protein